MKLPNSILISFLLLTVFALNVSGQSKNPILEFTNPFFSKQITQRGEAISPIEKDGDAVTVNKSHILIEVINSYGSFYRNLEKEKLSKDFLLQELNGIFNLNTDHQFKFISESKDDLGIKHFNYSQTYNGIPVEGCNVMIHMKNELVSSINGQVAQFENLETTATVSDKQALLIAKSHLKVTNLINEYDVETVISRIPIEGGTIKKLSKKVRIDSYSPFFMCYVYVDALSGNILNKVNLIAHADVAGTAQTLYSGNQNITCDSHNGAFRLRENGRKIETYNATNATGLTTNGYTGATDFVSNSTNWQGVPRITSFAITAIAQSWWYTALTDESPDLYIKVKDGSNQTVYTNNYINNTYPPFAITNLNIYLNNPPYSVEIWDHDAVGGDDFGGSYTIVSNVGTQSWSGNGNNGSYLIATSGHPALDVHWGMEKSYDFYLNTFNRNSFDGAGSLIKQYLNIPSSIVNTMPNNAFAAGAPYNIMGYGLGDGVTMSPVVGLDVEGHEFTHLVVNNNGNGGLVYQGESGALNESFADIFGTCIEFYSGVNPDWLIGEDVMIGQPFMRSMSNPNASQNPDTYNGQYWTNPSNLNYDNGGVHINSGVQNFWFYLLCQGGSGTNDLGNSYSVTGIGITQARQIAYKNLVTYLGPNATFMDAYYGSLQAAQDLYGAASIQYTRVREAWYAVGIGTNPNLPPCSGITKLTTTTGTITDGSGSANYQNNLNCSWLIQPTGADSILLTFSRFRTESNYDTVFVYNGPTTSSPLLMTWWGNTLPPTIKANSGAMLVRFSSDISNTDSGWSASYISYGTAYCNSGNILTTPIGSFSDGSGSNNYGNNSLCYWLIAPPCATSVTLSFTSFNTELNYDGVLVYNGSNTNAPLLLSASGASLPSNVTATSGSMLVVFVSDYISKFAGFAANYSSTGSAFCNGTTTMNTSDYGTITDGSDSNKYCNNTDCRWLIQPPQATSVKLTFTAFKTEPASTDGQSIYDAVEVYDGANTSAPLLGRFSGNNLPPSITSTTGSMYVRFFSDATENDSGWSAYYTSTTTSSCNGKTILIADTGSFTDGSGLNDYGNNANCQWLIQPPGSSSISLNFTSFDTELNYDGIIVYDGADTSATKLGIFTGNALPPTLISTGGSMLIWFLSDEALRRSGWAARYSSVNNCGSFSKPNPTAGFTINNSTQCLTGNNFIFSDTSKISSGTISRLWSFGDATTSTNSTENKTYNSANLYTVKLVVTSNNGCKDSVIKTVSVNPQPTATATAAGPTSFCQGGSVTLNANTGSGLNYQWRNNGATISGATNSSYSATASGNYKVVVTGSNSCVDSSAAVPVTVNSNPPTPTINSPANSFCTGQSVTLTCANSGYSYQWKKDGNDISGATNISLAINQAGSYTIEISNGNNCKSISATTSITENPNPAIPSITANGATTFCEGGQVTLSTSSTGLNYQWLKDSVNITGANSTSLIVNTTGNYQLDVTNTSNCKSSSATMIVNVFANPPKPSITLNGNSLFSSAAQGNQWFRNTLLITGAVSSSYTPTQSGSYTTQVSNSNNCQSMSHPFSFIMTGTKETESTPFLIYPNPNDGKFKVQSGFESSVVLEIYDILGKNILRKFNLSKGENDIDVSELGSGVYVLHIKYRENNYLEKLIIK